MRNPLVMKATVIGTLSVLLLLLECGLKSDYCKRELDISGRIPIAFREPKDGEVIVIYVNSVKGHKEEKCIVGNFTGHGLDSLYVEEVWDYSDDDRDWNDKVKYYAKSSNPQIPAIELYGYAGCAPKLVYEGDVDGDGKDEWGYLHTWVNSQWRYYRIYNYDNKAKKWRFLYYDAGKDPSLLDTTEAIRSSGLDIVEKGPWPGTIRINYDPFFTDDAYFKYRIVKPTYTPITKDNW